MSANSNMTCAVRRSIIITPPAAGSSTGSANKTTFKGQTPTVGFIMITSSKTGHNNNQYSKLHRALTLEAGKFDKDAINVVKLLNSHQELSLTRHSIKEIYGDVDTQYYPGTMLPSKKDDNFDTLLMLRENAVTNDDKRHEDMIKAYNNNKNKL